MEITGYLSACFVRHPNGALSAEAGPGRAPGARPAPDVRQPTGARERAAVRELVYGGTDAS
ncbi:hypothetical protein [Actinoplanes teichomyceticus]|uniref:hypothetical protein n=1 Tax=Actinoplanes teichomyceticus TaxID=1867 RepID=UPI000F09D7A8|nr:hypothetical protein [Actinoplanes teichomyceticus]GIF13730.1 hypothetical protein Ate01nite_37620 [Actinoplanes teichomyceticus]